MIKPASVIPPITTAMVMAAGQGTRMQPLTNDRCKALVMVGGKPLIDHMLDRLHAAGIRRAIVNVHAFADKLESHLSARTIGPEIVISDERSALLETGGGVVKALPLLGTAPILICNIDAIWLEFEAVLPRLMAGWNPAVMDELFLLTAKENALGYDGRGDFDVEKNLTLIRKPGKVVPYIYAGVEIFKPKLATKYSQQKFSRNKIWDKSLTRKRIRGHVMQGYWMHVSNPRALGHAQAVLKQAQK